MCFLPYFLQENENTVDSNQVTVTVGGTEINSSIASTVTTTTQEEDFFDGNNIFVYVHTEICYNLCVYC